MVTAPAGTVAPHRRTLGRSPPRRHGDGSVDGPDSAHGRAATVLTPPLVDWVANAALAVGLGIVTTWLSLRLLGVRRGWAKAAVAGIAGWTIGTLLTLGLNGWDWGSEDLILETLAIAVPATMAVAVGFDLLARPGTLARAEQAGMITAPRLVSDARRRIDVLRRYRELLRLLRAQGLGPLLGAGGRAAQQAEPLGVRLRRVLEQAGGVYVKLGQIAATRVDMLPPAVCEELAELQSRAPQEDPERIRAVLEAELGPVQDTFAEFDWEPLAAASIGQTHVARLHSGEAVVVKVQRPDIADVMERDLAALALVAGLAERRTSVGRSVHIGEILGAFAASLRAELDLRGEARATADMARLVAADRATASTAGERRRVRVPRVYPDLCTARVLVQERLEGFSADDADRLAAMGADDRRALAEGLLATVMREVIEYGFFHADPHPGNVFVLDDGSLGLIDFGAVGRLDALQRTATVEILGGLVRNDVGLLRDGIEQVSDVGDVSGDRLDRTIARLVADNVRPGGGVEPTALQDMVPALAALGIVLPADLVLLARSLVTLDGTVQVLSPGVSVVSAAMRLAGPTAGDEAGPVDPRQLAKDELTAAALRLRRLPDRIDRIAALTSRGDLRLRTVVSEDETRVLRTLVNRALLALVGSALLVAAALLFTALDASPTVVGDTSLLTILGYGGLLTGTVLVLRVVAAVARDGTV